MEAPKAVQRSRSSVHIASAYEYRVGARDVDIWLTYQCTSRWTAVPPVHELRRSNQSGNAIDGTRAAEAAPCADIMHSGYHERQAQQGARERVHRDQHSTIQMDRLNHKYRPRSDTHHFDPTLSSSGCRPRGRCASAPPGQSCAVRQRIRLWQRRGAARRSRPSSARVGLFSDAKVS